jgi:hypothetical protein
MEDATRELARNIAARRAIDRENLPFNFELAIEGALFESLGHDMSNLKSDTWARLFTSGTSETNTLARLVVSQVIGELLGKKLVAGFPDRELREAALKEFVNWSARALVVLADNRGTSLQEMLSLRDWAGELESQRRSLRLTPLQPTTSPAKPQSRFSSRSKKVA